MKTIGILGGCSDIATGHMYRRINALGNARLGGWHIPETLIAGMDFGVVERCVRESDWGAMSAYMETHLDRLAPADIVICGSNTIHKVLPSLMEGRDQTFIHIYEPTAREAKARGLRTLALFGTLSTMSGGYAEDYYAAHGLRIVVPTPDEQADIDRIIFDELCRADVRNASRDRYLDVADRLRNEAGVGGLILGCTEIETLLKPEHLPQLGYLDTMELLCREAVDVALARSG